jgi:hypothetical protein
MEESVLETAELSQSGGPVACVKCGTAEHLSRQRFEKTYTPKWVYVGLLFGLFPAAILMLFANKKHRLKICFCSACWDRYHKAKIISYLLTVPCLLLFIMGPIFGLAYKSWIIALSCIATAIVIAVFIDLRTRSVSPKCVLLNRENIVLAIPGYGDIDMAQAKL